jgi:hypothetical protein
LAERFAYAGLTGELSHEEVGEHTLAD